MWISNVEVRGLEGLPEDGRSWSLDRIQRADDPRLADALVLFGGALAEGRRADMQGWLGWTGTWTDDELALDAVAFELVEGARPSVVVEAEVRPDPPLYGRLREAVLRDPRLAMGLASGTLTVRVGWLATPDRRVVRPDLLGVRLGEIDLPLAELPGWVRPLLADIGHRIVPARRVADLEADAERVRAALHGQDRLHRKAARALLDVLELELLLTDDGVRFTGAGLMPLRWADRESVERIGLACTVLLGRPDVLVAGRSSSDGWLEQQLAGDDAALEQVVIA